LSFEICLWPAADGMRLPFAVDESWYDIFSKNGYVQPRKTRQKCQIISEHKTTPQRHHNQHTNLQMK
jgi:hypothetical protein